MNEKEYTRAIKDTRRAIYRKDFGGAVVGILRAFVARNEPEALPPAPPPPRRLTTKLKSKSGKVVRRK